MLSDAVRMLNWKYAEKVTVTYQQLFVYADPPAYSLLQLAPVHLQMNDNQCVAKPRLLDGVRRLFSVEAARDNDEWQGVLQHPAAQQLQQVHLRGLKSSELLHALVSLPRLRSLWLQLDDEGIDDDVQALLQRLLARSSFTELYHLNHSTGSEDFAKSILSHPHSLCRLHIGASAVHSLWRELQHYSAPSMAQLQVLSLMYLDITRKGTREAIQSGLSALHHLHTLRLHLPYYIVETLPFISVAPTLTLLYLCHEYIPLGTAVALQALLVQMPQLRAAVELSNVHNNEDLAALSQLPRVTTKSDGWSPMLLLPTER
jgi:hypothetical protein